MCPLQVAAAPKSQCLFGTLFVMRAIALVVTAVLAVIGIGIVLVGGAGTSAPSPLRSLVANLTPSDWQPVDFGNAQISVPPFLTVSYDQPCRQQGVDVGYAEPQHHEKCGTVAVIAPEPKVAIIPISKAPPPRGATRASINGIPVEERTRNDVVEIWASTLGIFLSVDGGTYNASIIRTLNYSPAAEVLATGPAPAVPSTWRWVTVDSVQFAVPRSWLETNHFQLPACVGYPEVPMNQVSIDPYTPQGVMCQAHLFVTFPGPTNGVVAHRHPSNFVGFSPERLVGQCLAQQGLRLCPDPRPLTPSHDQNAEIDILFEQVTVQSTGRRYLIEIGLAGDGVAARTILRSLRAA